MALFQLFVRARREFLMGLTLLGLAGCAGVVDMGSEEGSQTANGDGDGDASGDGDGDGDEPGSSGDGDEPSGDGDQTDDPQGDGDGTDDPGGDDPGGDGDVDPPPVAGCKRGVAYGYHSPADLEALSAGISWWYNWAPRPDEGVASVYSSIGVDFVPMVWGKNFDVDEVVSAIPDTAKYLLGFNEPNFGVQSDMTPEEAAALWPQVEEIAQRKGLTLLSPALNFCGGDCNETDPFVYLQKFFAACEGCKVDAIAAHWYACTGDALSWYLDQLGQFGKPIWLTEFSCGDDADRSLEKQKQYMTDALKVLEADTRVARYAWFSGRTDAIPNVSLLGSDGQLTELGQLYVSLPRAAGCEP